MAADEQVADPYDEVLYPDFVHTRTDLSNLAAIGTLFGMQPACPDSARVLELACGTAANTISLASLYPNSQFVGIDLSARQIEKGQQVIDELELDNIELRCQSITDCVDEGDFDYIIAHGVYSWVPDPIRQCVLELCQRMLSPQGIALVSYNTFPGWHSKLMIREMFRYETRNCHSPAERLAVGKRFLTDLVGTVPDTTGYGKTLREELQSLEASNESYVYHEQFEAINEPRYFHDFVDEIRPHSLKYFAEANLSNLQLQTLPATTANELKRLSSLDREQRLDFLRRRTFRQSLLCRETTPVNETVDVSLLNHDTLDELFVNSTLRYEGSVSGDSLYQELLAQDVARFVSGNVLSASLRSPATKIGVALLSNHSSSCLQLRDLSKQVERILGQFQGESTIDSAAIGRTLRSELIDLAVSGLVEVRVTNVKANQSVPAKPMASPLARLRARTDESIPNAWHRMIRLDMAARYLLQIADGTNDRDAMIDALVKRIQDDGVVLQNQGAPVTDVELMRSLVGEKLEPNLQSLANFGFFLSDSE